MTGPEQKNWSDPIVDEIHEYRRQHAEQFQGDIDAIIADIKTREDKDGQKVVCLGPKRLQPTGKEEQR